MNLKIWHLTVFAAIIILIVVLLLPNSKEQGVLLARSGKIERAAEKLQKIIHKDPSDISSVEELAKGYLAANQPKKGIFVYEEFLKANKSNEEIEKELINLYIADYQYSEAATLLDKNQDENLDELIDLSVKTGNLDKAVKYTRDKLLAIGDDKNERIKLLKNIEKYEEWQLNTKGLEDAKEEIAKIEGTLDSNVKALEYFVWKNDKPKMNVYAKKVGSFKNLTLKDLRLLRTTWISLKNAPESLKVAEMVTKMQGAELDDWNNYLTLLEWSGKKKDADIVLDKLIAEYPDNIDLLWRSLALTSNDGKSLKRAELDEKLFSMTGDVNLVRDALLIYSNLNDTKRTDKLYQKLLSDKRFMEEGAVSIENKLLFVDLYRYTNNKKQAQKYLNEIYAAVSGKKIEDVEEGTILSVIANALKDDEKLLAANLYRNYYAVNADNQMLRDARDLYGELKLDNEYLEVDQILLDKGVLDPYELQAMAKVYRRIGDVAKARAIAKALYKEVLGEVHNTEVDPYWAALDAAEDDNDTLTRAKIIERFSKINPDPELQRQAAALYKELGMYKEQLAVYAKMRKTGILNSYDTGELLAVYDKLGIKDKLAALTTEVFDNVMASKTLDKEGDQFYLLLDLLPRLGRDKDRVRLIEKYAAGGDVEAKIYLAEYYQDSKMLAEARIELEAIIDDKEVSKEMKDRAALQLAYMISTEFYNATTDPERVQVMREGKPLVTKVIDNLEENLLSFKGEALVEREGAIDEFKILLIRLAVIEDDYIGVDQLLSELYRPDSGVYLELSNIFFDNKEEDTAKRYFKKVDDTSKFTKEQFAQLGYMYSAFEEYDKALLSYMKADNMANGLDKDIRIGLASVYGNINEISKQYRIVDFYTTFKDSTVEDWVRAADARTEHNNLEEEYKVLARAVEKQPKSSLLISRIVSRLIGYGKAEEAIVYARKLEGLKVVKEERELITVGYGLLDVGQVREAGRMFAVASNIDEKNVNAKLALARYFVACYQYPEAHKIYKHYLLENNDDSRIWYEYAVLKRTAGFVGSRAAFLKAKQLLQDGKQGAEEMSIISSIEFYLNRQDSAIARAKYAHKLAPEDDVYALNLAELYNSYNYPEYGKKVAGGVVENDFNSSRRNGLLAESELMARRFVEGIDDLKQLLEVRNEDSLAQLAMGYSEVEIGEWIEGADDLMVGEIKSNREEEKRVSMHDNGLTKKMLSRVRLPDIEE